MRSFIHTFGVNKERTSHQHATIYGGEEVFHYIDELLSLSPSLERRAALQSKRKHLKLCVLLVCVPRGGPWWTVAAGWTENAAVGFDACSHCVVGVVCAARCCLTHIHTYTHTLFLSPSPSLSSILLPLPYRFCCPFIHADLNFSIYRRPLHSIVFTLIFNPKILTCNFISDKLKLVKLKLLIAYQWIDWLQFKRFSWSIRFLKKSMCRVHPYW